MKGVFENPKGPQLEIPRCPREGDETNRPWQPNNHCQPHFPGCPVPAGGKRLTFPPNHVAGPHAPGSPCILTDHVSAPHCNPGRWVEPRVSPPTPPSHQRRGPRGRWLSLSSQRCPAHRAARRGAGFPGSRRNFGAPESHPSSSDPRAASPDKPISRRIQGRLHPRRQITVNPIPPLSPSAPPAGLRVGDWREDWSPRKLPAAPSPSPRDPIGTRPPLPRETGRHCYRSNPRRRTLGEAPWRGLEWAGGAGRGEGGAKGAASPRLAPSPESSTTSQSMNLPPRSPPGVAIPPTDPLTIP